MGRQRESGRGWTVPLNNWQSARNCTENMMSNSTLWREFCSRSCSLAFTQKGSYLLSVLLYGAFGAPMEYASALEQRDPGREWIVPLKNRAQFYRKRPGGPRQRPEPTCAEE